MTFGISRDHGAFEWAGTSLNAIFAQRANLLRPSMWRMIFDIIRFNQFALDLLSSEDETSQSAADLSIGEYLDREGYSSAFRDDYLIPMTAGVWSTGPDKCALEFPAVTLVRFMWNHHLLSTIATRPEWRTIKGGAQRYIDAVMRDFPASRVRLSTPVRSLKNDDSGRVVLGLPNGEQEVFDDVVLACHGDQAYNIISSSATKTGTDILSCFETTPNTTYLHSDLSLMPRRRLAWSSWNYLTVSSSSPLSSSPSPPPPPAPSPPSP